jgi:hypothetical protein
MTDVANIVWSVLNALASFAHGTASMPPITC